MVGSLPSSTTSSKDLILIPSDYEKKLGGLPLESLAASSNADVQLCGVGLVQAGIKSMYWLRALKPSRVWLLGIAGTYQDRLKIAHAYQFSHIGCYGIGVGSGSHYQSPTDLGWAQSLEPGLDSYVQLVNDSEEIGLLSVAAASADFAEAEEKLQKHPSMMAEDMESFAVARACQLCGIQLRVIRGISNRVGDRNHGHWRMADAMHACVTLASQLMRVP